MHYLVFKKLQEDIPQNKIAARFVGGCVRKYLSNEKIEHNHDVFNIIKLLAVMGGLFGGIY